MIAASNQPMQSSVAELAARARRASRQLAKLSESARNQALFGIAGRMRAAEHYHDSWMRLLQAPRFLDGLRQLAGHAADARHANGVLADEGVHNVVGYVVEDVIENLGPMSVLAQPCRQMDIVDRHVLNVTIGARHRTDEHGLHCL